MPTTTANTTRYDKFGRAAGYINPIEGAPEPYRIYQVSPTTMYIFFYETGSDPTAVRRVVQLPGGDTQVCTGWGTQTNFETIDYYPVNVVLTVDNTTKQLVGVTPDVDPVDPITAS